MLAEQLLSPQLDCSWGPLLVLKHIYLSVFPVHLCAAPCYYRLTVTLLNDIFTFLPCLFGSNVMSKLSPYSSLLIIIICFQLSSRCEAPSARVKLIILNLVNLAGQETTSLVLVWHLVADKFLHFSVQESCITEDI